MDKLVRPGAVNHQHFSAEQFPEIIAFCERDNKSHVVTNTEETYEYKLHGKTIYMVKKCSGKWEIVEFDDKSIVRVSTSDNLGMVLMSALTFKETDRPKQDARTNILIPVNVKEREKALALMYYFGGYPTSLLPVTAEYLLIKEKFIDPQYDFLAYSFVPIEYIAWLREELKNAGITGHGKNMTIWIYKK